MKIFIGFILALVLLSGCAEERKFVKNPLGKEDVLLCQAEGYSPFGGFYNSNSQVDRSAFPGFFTFEGDASSTVVSGVVGEDNLIRELRKGDAVTSVDGVPVISKKQYIQLVQGYNPDQTAIFTFRRLNREFSLAIRLNTLYAPMLYSLVADRLNAGSKTSIAVIPSANTAAQNSNLNVSGLIENDKSLISSSYEKMLLDEFRPFAGFSVIDRDMLENIMKEVTFQKSGFVDDQTIVRIGKMTGATHLMFVTLSRYEDSTAYVERLVEVESTKVLYSNNYKIMKPKVVKKKIYEDEGDGRRREKSGKKDDKPVIIINNINNNGGLNNTTINNK